MNTKNKPVKYVRGAFIFIFAITLIDGCVPESKGNAMNKEEIRRMFLEIYNDGKVELIDVLFAPEFVSRNQGRNPGQQEIRDHETLKIVIRELRTASPDIQLIMDDILVDGDMAAWRGTFNGTHTGPLKIAGKTIPPTKKKFKMGATAFLRFKNGRIVETYGLNDMLSLMQQLGLVAPAK